MDLWEEKIQRGKYLIECTYEAFPDASAGAAGKVEALVKLATP